MKQKRRDLLFYPVSQSEPVCGVNAGSDRGRDPNNRASFKTPHFGRSLRWAQISILRIRLRCLLDDSGGIIIKTENKYLDHNIRGYEEVKSGEYAVLTVEDNGNGIPQNDLERIFEPFYSKKHMSRSGTGLGLAIVWNVVQGHEGYIDVTSGDKGTKFELYFR
jgi:signal transduction histidine kinase